MPSFRSLPTALVVALALTAPAGAQTATDSGTGTAAELPLGEPVGPRLGQTYVVETYNDWVVRCVKQEEGVREPCQIYQLLRDAEGNSVAEITAIALPPGSEIPGGATVTTPLGTLLSEAVVFAVDERPPLRYNFDVCTQQGCFARMGLTADLLDAMKKGAEGVVRIVPAEAPDAEVLLKVSLKGFTAGFTWLADRLKPAN